jgi:hypothetical protein
VQTDHGFHSSPALPLALLLLSGATFRFSIYDGLDTVATGYELFVDTIRAGDDGRILVATADNEPDFTGFAGLLTDGRNGLVTYSLTWESISNTSSTTYDATESIFFVGRPGAGPDFAGYTIDSIQVTIDSVDSSSGMQGELSVIGHPTGSARIAASLLAAADPPQSGPRPALYFHSPRDGGLGANDIYVITRSKLKGPD